MKKAVLSDLQGTCIVILAIAGTSLFSQTAVEAGSDNWLATLVAMVLAVPLFLMYGRLLSLYPEKDLFDILRLVFGKALGSILSIWVVWMTFQLGVMALTGYGDFPVTLSLPETPDSVFVAAMTLLCIWLVKEGIEVIGRWSCLFVMLDGPLPSILILFLIPEMDWNNVLPVLYGGWKPFAGGVYSAFIFPFAETIVFIMIALSFRNKKSPYKVLLQGLVWGGSMIVGVTLTEMLVLGKDIYAATYFPNHSAASDVHIAELVQRLEVLTIIATITAGTIKISLCLMAISTGISKLFGFEDYRLMVWPVGLLFFNAALFMHKNIFEVTAFSGKIWPLYAFPFLVLLPVLLWIGAEWKHRGKKKNCPTGQL